jgi:hypothetical protein
MVPEPQPNSEPHYKPKKVARFEREPPSRQKVEEIAKWIDQETPGNEPEPVEAAPSFHFGPELLDCHWGLTFDMSGSWRPQAGSCPFDGRVRRHELCVPSVHQN